MVFLKISIEINWNCILNHGTQNVTPSLMTKPRAHGTENRAGINPYVLLFLQACRSPAFLTSPTNEEAGLMAVL